MVKRLLFLIFAFLLAAPAANASYYLFTRRHVTSTTYVSNTDYDDEDMADISDWTDSDGGTGASTQATFDGQSTMKLTNGNAGGSNYSWRKQDVGEPGGDVTVTLRMYFDLIGTLANTDYFMMRVDYGANGLFARWASDGFYVFDGATNNEVGVNIVTLDAWHTWSFYINAAASTVDVYLDNVLQQSGVDCSAILGNPTGTIDFIQYGTNTANCITYIDWFKCGDAWQ